VILTTEPKGLLTSNEFRLKIRDLLNEARTEAILVSAFVTETAVKWIFEEASVGLPVTIVARWAYRDLSSGASDFSSYWETRKRGGRFFMDPQLHTKVYMFDRSQVILGSANLTGRGLWLNGSGNEELVTCLRPDILDIDRVVSAIGRSVELNDELVRVMEAEVDRNGDTINEWPTAVSQRLIAKIDGLWMNDLLKVGPREICLEGGQFSDDAEGAMGILGLEGPSLDVSLVKEAFKKTKVYAWLLQIMRDEEHASFGRLSAVLHDSVFDDPRPYRREIKNCVNALFDWVEFAEDPVIKITHYGRTSVIRWIA